MKKECDFDDQYCTYPTKNAHSCPWQEEITKNHKKYCKCCDDCCYQCMLNI